MNAILKSLSIILIICVALEVFFFFSVENIFACIIMLSVWFLYKNHIFSKDTIANYPLITLTLLAMIMFYYFLPIVVTLVERKPVTYNLDSPYLTFVYQFFYAISLFGAFFWFKKNNGVKLSNFLDKFGFYYIPTAKGIWILGIVGLLSMAFSNGHSNIEAQDRSSLDRFFEGFTFMCYAPLIFFSIPSELKDRIKKQNKFLLFGYVVVLLILAVLTNRRHYLFAYVLTPLLLIFVNIIVERREFHIKTSNVIVIILSSYLLFGPVTDFCLAMFVQRALVYDIKGKDLWDATIKTYNDKDALESMYRWFSEEQASLSSFGYTEYYVDNILLNRLCNLKPIDNSVTYTTKIDCATGNSFMQQKLVEKIEYLLPSPVLKLVDPNFEKFKEASYGFHDYLINVANKVSGGGYRVGGDSGIAYATFGIFAPILVILFYGLFFYVINAFWNSNYLSIYAICKVFEVFYIFQSNHGFMDDINMLLRFFPQEILLYLIIIMMIKKIKV